MTNVPDEIAMVFAAAQTQQQMADAAIEQLKRHTQQLEPLVRDAVRRALADGLRGLHAETDRALTGLQELHRAALPRAFWFTLGSAAFGSSGLRSGVDTTQNMGNLARELFLLKPP
jgi:hypothetical protein